MRDVHPTLTRPAAAILVVLFAASCGPGMPTARDTLDPFLAAVQERDAEALYCMLAGAAESTALGANESERREGFADWLDAHYEAYEIGRDSGFVEPDEQGIALTKTLALGKGTFFELRSPLRAGPDGLRVRMDLRMGYGALPLSRFSPGTTFYVCGVPLGRIHALEVPAHSTEVAAEVLETVSLEWSLVRREAGAGCPERWAVAAVAPIEGSITSRDITWVF